MAIKLMNEHWTIDRTGRQRPKHAYADYYKALFVLGKHPNSQDLHVYKCGFCGMYHIGHRLNLKKNGKMSKVQPQVNEENLYDMLLAKYGKSMQMDQTEEECMELGLALRHYRRGKASDADVVTEVADVAIMCRQLARIFGEEKVRKEMDRKLRRQAARLLDGGLVSEEEYSQIVKEG